MVAAGSRDNGNEETRVYLMRGARTALARLDPGRRATLSAAFQRVGRELLAQGQQVPVASSWSRRTWPRRRYPQQCYPKTLKYVREHPDIPGMRLVHGVISHADGFAPLDHAWVELPGGIVFDGVVQAFFSGDSYHSLMAAMPLDSYSSTEAERLLATHGHSGPWNARWVPTPAQLEAYYAATHTQRELRSVAPRGWQT